MFDFNEYKKYLIEYCVHACDNDEAHRLMRKKVLERFYSDNRLQEIMKNTEEFLINFLEICIKNEKAFYQMPLDFRNEYIFTNCAGGCHPDTLVSIDGIETKKISLHLVLQFLGKSFSLDFKDNVVESIAEEFDDFAIGRIESFPELVISGDLEILKEKYEELKTEEQISLTRTKE